MALPHFLLIYWFYPSSGASVWPANEGLLLALYFYYTISINPHQEIILDAYGDL